MSLETLKMRINYMGGDSLGRIKQQKLNSFYAALKKDYNSRPILTPLGEEFQALINDDNTKPDYDKRFVSVDFDAQLNPGDVFECTDDNTHWMIYLPDLVEIAYLKAEIIRCRYQLTIGENDYWIYFQGPTETAVRWNLKNNITWNDMNFSGTVYIQKTEETEKYFDRFTKLKIDGHRWQIKVVDTITVPGIIELEVQEYFDNLTEDIPEVKKMDNQTTIFGQTTVYPDSIVGYQIGDSLLNDSSKWTITDNNNVIILETQLNNKICKVHVKEKAEGFFNINYGETTLKINIDQPQEMINGDIEVYPYNKYHYIASNSQGQFSLKTNKAVILNQENGECDIEIIDGKKGFFELVYTINDQIYSILIKILSL